MWRPKEEWNNPFKDEIEQIKQRTISEGRNPDECWLGESSVGFDAFEAGADAILEALKKTGFPCKKGEAVYPITGSPFNSYLVFIPDIDN